jgi:hypothetical protein
VDDIADPAELRGGDSLPAPAPHAFPAALWAELKYSLGEHSQVLVYFRSGEVRGVVTRLDDEVVELALATRRCVIRLDRVDAVVSE